jgi:hypothetical protein
LAVPGFDGLVNTYRFAAKDVDQIAFESASPPAAAAQLVSACLSTAIHRCITSMTAY